LTAAKACSHLERLVPEARKGVFSRANMLPRYAADYRTLVWVMFMPIVALAQYARPDLIVYL